MIVVLSFATHVEWHEGHAIARALARLGHDVRVVDAESRKPRAQSREPKAESRKPRAESHPDFFPVDAALDDVLDGVVPDLFLYIEPQGLLPRGLERAPCRTVCVLCDTALSLAPRQDLAKLFDEVVLYHRDSLHAFPEHGDRVHWMPFAVDVDLFPPASESPVPNAGRAPKAERPEPRAESPDPRAESRAPRAESRDLDIAYIGSLDGIWRERRRLLASLRARYRTNDFERRVSNEEMAAVYRRAKIVFHLPIVDTIAPRVFEAMAAGAMLLTGRCDNGLDLLFDDGVHLVTFDGERDLMEKAEHYLTHDAERARVAAAGHALVHEKHVWEPRLQALLAELCVGVTGPDAFGTGASRPLAPARRMTPAAVDDIYQRHYKQRGAVDALVRAAARAPWLSSRRWLAAGRAAATAWARRGVTPFTRSA